VSILPHEAKGSEVILSVAESEHNCLKWSHEKFKTRNKFGMHDLHSCL